ncbi:nitrate/nitrite transporter [Cystobacter fuscus]|uniref:nitrate/nitrite transporter n=1 Tax=Cystobacter fuscus TaxID=43 RepID=UPI0037BEB509
MNPTTEAKAPSGHLPTLIACFMHFDLSFTLWVLLGALGVFVAEDAGLSATQKGWLVAMPILSGSLARIPVGLLSDHLGGKRVGVALLCFLFLPLALGWQVGESFSSLVAVGLLLGVGGASFAVVLPLASRWYPPHRQGLVMGIAAAGNSGTILTNLFAPKLALLFGWHKVFGLAMLPLALVLLAFLILAKDSPDRARRPAAGGLLDHLKKGDVWWFCLFYSITFGGYVGLSSFLPLFFRDQYGVSQVTAGSLTALAALLGSTSRPLGGYLADKVGGVRLLLVLLVAVGMTYECATRLPSLNAMVLLLLVAMTCLGMGNGAVFQVVPLRFPREIGGVTGIIGAVGGLGGFMLPTLLATIRARMGSFSGGFLILGLISLGAALILRVLLWMRAQWAGLAHTTT